MVIVVRIHAGTDTDRLCIDWEVKEPAQAHQARNEFPNLGEAILTGR